MAIVADTYTYVVGVDTHAATHHYAIVETRSGGQIAHGKFPTHAAGLLRAVDWISRRTSVDDNPAVDQVLISMEGTGSYGAQAAELLAARGYRVVDAPSPKRARGSGKNDHIDALVAARGALPKDSERLADRRAGHTRAALQILLTARDSMRRDRTRSKNQLTALLRTHNLDIDAHGHNGLRGPLCGCNLEIELRKSLGQLHHLFFIFVCYREEYTPFCRYIDS